jgi:hypothetical protein
MRLFVRLSVWIRERKPRVLFRRCVDAKPNVFHRDIESYRMRSIASHERTTDIRARVLGWI